MHTLNCKGTLLSLEKPVVMGIINVNNDSFFESSRMAGSDQALEMAAKMLDQGAAILDFGGQSTRPGSQLITAEEEAERVIPVIEAAYKSFPKAIISIDTFYSEVASAAVNAGAKIVNDISAGSLDSKMLFTVAELNVPYIAMHMQGSPQTMQQKKYLEYNNLVVDVMDYFIKKIDACKKSGIVDIIIDPGFGFSKNRDQSYTLLKSLSDFRILQRPILVGVSRKSMIQKFLNISSKEALNASTVLHTYALQNGANIIRTHDVQEGVQAIRLLEKLEQI